MTEDTYLVPVKTALPTSQYQRLYRLAETHNTSVGDLVRELVRRQLTVPEPVKKRPKRRRLSQEDLDQIRELSTKGMSDTQIAKALGIAQGTVSTHRGRMDLEPNFIGRRRIRGLS